MIEKLVHGFYSRARSDELIGPIFALRVEHWDLHLDRMCQFWSSVILASGRYHGQPMSKHVRLPVDAKHFDRWLDLFGQTARELCPPAAAQFFIERAQLIAQSLEMGIAGAHGVLLDKDQRYTLAPPRADSTA